jgi:hypothetical protein
MFVIFIYTRTMAKHDFSNVLAKSRGVVVKNLATEYL